MGFEPTTVGCLPPTAALPRIEVRRSIQTELRALYRSETIRPKKRFGFDQPSNRYSEVTYGRRLNSQYAIGRPTIVTARKAAAFAQSQLSHQPTRTK